LLNLLVNEPVDLIITDPPYPKEFLPVWNKLGQLAHRILKPGGLMIAYSGSKYLPDVMSNLAEYLEYVDTGSIHYGFTEWSTTWSAFWTHIHPGSKPLLFYSNQKYHPLGDVSNTFEVQSKNDKSLHKWQQDIAPFEYYVTKLTKENDLVCDPFLGSGTTAVVCKKLNRRFVGCDIDEACIKTTEERLATTPEGDASASAVGARTTTDFPKVEGTE
jgi:DNA modification methylase